MKKLVFSSLVLCSLLLIGLSSKAQDYQTAVGLKFGGYENGLSIKYFSSSNVSLEGILGFRSHGVVITGLYELNQEAFNVADLKFYYGAGAHIGSEGAGVYHSYGTDRVYDETHLLLGIDGVVGLEYKFPEAPIAVSLDLDPRIELATGPFVDIAPGLGLKYTF